jgi:hypothetical protein
MANIYQSIKHLYEKQTYLSKYGGDLIVAGVLILIACGVVAYYQTMNNIGPIKADWTNRRCDPSVMPFAGAINGESGKSTLQYTADNFAGCVQNVIGDLSSYTLAPMYYVMNTLVSSFDEATKSMQSMRATFSNARENTQNLGEDVMGRSLNVALPIVQLTSYVKDTFNKAAGTVAAAVYTLFGGYLSAISFFWFVIELVHNVLLILAATMIGLLAIAWFFPAAFSIAFSLAMLMFLVYIPWVIVTVIMNSMFDQMDLPSPPPVPSACFSGDTMICKKSGPPIRMDSIRTGDILADGSIVTAVMKSTASNQEVYHLDDVIVTGRHKVMYANMRWINVCDHPRSILLDDFRDHYVYCVADWDEITDRDMEELRAHVLKNSREQMIVFEETDIHRKFDTCFSANTIVCLEDGRSVPIKDVAVNDVLSFGEVVRSVVEVKASDIETYQSFYANGTKLFSCASNIALLDSYLPDSVQIIKETVTPPTVGYHLVTDTGRFQVQGLVVGDYNAGIDRHLSGFEARKQGAVPDHS